VSLEMMHPTSGLIVGVMRWSPRLLAVGVAIVAVLAVAIAFQPDQAEDASADPSPMTLYRSAPELIPAGEYVVDKLFDGRITFDLPENWTGLEHMRGQALIVKTEDAQPFGEVGPTVLLGIYAVDRVYEDPCRDRDPQAGAPPTLAGVLAGLTHAVGFEAGPIEDTTLGGLPAKVFDLRTSIDGEDCRTLPYSQWSFRDQNGVGRGNGTSSGGHQRLWLLDFDGTVILIDADSGDDSNSGDVEELYEIVESIRFE
jgi:hypothetical protein